MRLLTVKQAMAILGIKQATMYKLLAEHQIPHVKIRGRKQINEDDLKKYVKQNTSKPPQKTDDDIKYDIKNMERFKYIPGMKVID